jgi:hypothetical protein
MKVTTYTAIIMGMLLCCVAAFSATVIVHANQEDEACTTEQPTETPVERIITETPLTGTPEPTPRLLPTPTELVATATPTAGSSATPTPAQECTFNINLDMDMAWTRCTPLAAPATGHGDK